MRVLLTLTSIHPDYGGPALSVPRLAAALAQVGCTTGIWAADRQDAAGFSRHMEEVGVAALKRPLKDAVERFKPDLIHDNGIWLSQHHALAALSRSMKLCRIVSARGMLAPWALKHKRLKKSIAWLLYQRRDLSTADALHATSQVEAENITRLMPGKPVWMVPNGVDVPALQLRPAGTPNRHLTAVFLGRIYPVKGLALLVKAWAGEHPPGWRLLIVGPDEGGHQSEIEKLVAEAGLGEAIRFVGPLYGEAKHRVLREADLFILPSHSESFGMAIAEALAYGLPVLTTTSVPWPLIEEYGCGWRVEPTVEGIAAGLRVACACEREALQRMGSIGNRLVAQKFGWDDVARRFLRHYDQLLAKPTR